MTNKNLQEAVQTLMGKSTYSFNIPKNTLGLWVSTQDVIWVLQNIYLKEKSNGEEQTRQPDTEGI